MTRSTKEKIIVGLVLPLLVAAVWAFFMSVSNAASKTDLEKLKIEQQEDLKNAKVEVKAYTDDKVKAHADMQTETEIRVNETLKRMVSQIDYLYLRELEKNDKKLYLKELERIQSLQDKYRK